MTQHNGDKQRGYINYLRVLAGCYLLYLAYRLLRGIWDGTTDTAALNAAGGLLFAAVGAALLWREWKAYQYAKKHRDDPDTWTRDDILPESGEDAAPSRDAASGAEKGQRDE